MRKPTVMPEKDPANIEPYFFVWCDPNGVNNGASNDKGELQGAAIASYSLTFSSTDLASTTDTNQGAVTVADIDYAINTVVTVWLTGGTEGNDVTITCEILTNETPVRTLRKSMLVPVRTQ